MNIMDTAETSLSLFWLEETLFCEEAGETAPLLLPCAAVKAGGGEEEDSRALLCFSTQVTRNSPLADVFSRSSFADRLFSTRGLRLR